MKKCAAIQENIIIWGILLNWFKIKKNTKWKKSGASCWDDSFCKSAIAWGLPFAHIGLVSSQDHHNYHNNRHHHHDYHHDQMGSLYMTLCLSVERYLALIHPFWYIDIKMILMIMMILMISDDQLEFELESESRSDNKSRKWMNLFRIFRKWLSFWHFFLPTLFFVLVFKIPKWGLTWKKLKRIGIFQVSWVQLSKCPAYRSKVRMGNYSYPAAISWWSR